MKQSEVPKYMKAIRMHSRGSPGDLVFEDAPTPHPNSGEVLIRVFGASITPTELTWNSSYTNRHGEERLPVIPSFEVSGKIAMISKGVNHLKIGDEVYGLLDFWKNGGAAEYVAIEAKDIALKPVTISHTAAAALPLSGLTAWQALFDHGVLQPGQKVLIHGAAGGVGSLAVQMAHWKGAHVTATCSKGKDALVRQLGADEVIDYASQKFEDIVHEIDLAIDTVGGDTLRRSYQTLKRGGKIVTVADGIDEETAREYGVTGIAFLVQPNGSELREMALLVDSGKIRPVVQEVFPLKSAREAFIKGMENHNTGKIVLNVVSQNV